MINDNGVFIDIHEKLRPYEQVISFLSRVEEEFSIKKYCNGANEGGRWIYQIYSIEFIRDLSVLMESVLVKVHSKGTVLEVMAGDGMLSHYLSCMGSVNPIPSDNKSSRDDIAFSKDMETVDAIEAVRKYTPALVLLSWEPYYSDISLSLVESGIPVIWIGNPDACAVSSHIHDIDYVRHESSYLLGRHDCIETNDFKTQIRVYNLP